MLTAPNRDEEWCKKITAALSDGRTFVLIDNLIVALASAHLASALTAEVWEDRVLGVSRMVRIRQHAGLGSNRQQRPPRRRHAAARLLDPDGRRPRVPGGPTRRTAPRPSFATPSCWAGSPTGGRISSPPSSRSPRTGSRKAALGSPSRHSGPSSPGPGSSAPSSPPPASPGSSRTAARCAGSWTTPPAPGAPSSPPGSTPSARRPSASRTSSS
jgi:hypothetical protein